MDRLEIIGVVLFIIAIIIFIVFGALLIVSDYHIEEVDCYDRRGNKIEGLTCEERVNNNEGIYDLVWIGGILALIGEVTFLLGSEKRMEGEW